MTGGPLRRIRANDPGPFTLDGTITWIVGHRRLAVIDPGPDMDDHVRAVVSLAETADEVTILLTHGHADHAGAVDRVVQALPGARLVGHGHSGVEPPPAEGPAARTDAGDLIAIPTPGHTRDHLAFHWPETRTLFAGDMVLGSGNTTWVAEYPGCVADWLNSLERLSGMELDRVLSAHGPPIDDPVAGWSRFRRHRLDRIAAVRQALRVVGESWIERGESERLDLLFQQVYGDRVPPGLESAARRSLDAVLEYVDTHPEVG